MRELWYQQQGACPVSVTCIPSSSPLLYSSPTHILIVFLILLLTYFDFKMEI